MTTTADVLDRAADLCEQHGLYKGSYWPGANYDDLVGASPHVAGDPACAVGWVYIAATDLGGLDYREAVDALLSQLETRGECHSEWMTTAPHQLPSDITDWSDRDTTTASDVSAAMRDTAVYLRAAGALPIGEPT